jgi:predicted small lipoprotein YifL
MTDINRRRLLQIGGAALTAGLAGCGLFGDDTIPNSDAAADRENGNESANGNENSN